MERKSLYLLLALLMPIMTYADRVSEQEALHIAQQFMKGKVFKQATKARKLGNATCTGDNCYYIFNSEDKHGFVIVSGDDRTEQILGYSNEGYIDMDNLPENLRAWLDGYREQINAIQLRGSGSARRKAPHADWTAVKPLLRTKWNQFEPYNRMCPEVDGERSVTGCSATAMAQILYYLRCPVAQTTEIPAYQTSSLGITVPSLPATQFDWDKMLPVYNEYSGNYSEEEGNAVAKLMRYCGQAVEMDYTSRESRGFPWSSKLSSYFGTSRTVRQLHRNYYSTEVWEETIYNELSAKRPVLYVAATQLAEPHSLVCDGYDGDGRFHLNWGWGGIADGFYVLSLVTFPTDHEIYINIKAEDAIVTPVFSNYISSGVTTNIYKRSSVNKNFQGIKLDGYIRSAISIDDKPMIEYGWGLYRNNQLLDVVWTSKKEFDWSQNRSNTTAQVAIGSQLSDGYYQLRQLFRQRGGDWTACLYAYRYYYLAVISGNQLTVTPVDSEKGADYIVNGISFDGDLIANRQVTLNVKITNTGHTYLNHVYVCIDGVLWTVNGGYSNPGESTTIPVEFTLDRAGGHKMITICKDANQTNVLYTLEVDVAESSETKLSGTLTADSMTILGYTGYVNGTGELDVTLKVRNDATETFDDRIYYVATTFRDRLESFICGNSKVKLAPGEEAECHKTLTGLIPGSTYTISAHYFSGPYIQDLSEIINFYYGKKAGLEVVSVEHGKLKKGRMVPVKIHLRNTGEVMYENLFYSLNGCEPISFFNGKFKPGNEQVFYFTLQPNQSGKQELKICSDWEGNCAFYQESVEVGTPSAQTLSCSTSFSGMTTYNNKNYVPGDILEAVLHMKNEGSNLYDDDIILRLTKRTESDMIEKEYEEMQLSITLAPGDSIDLHKVFEGVVPGNYEIESSYYSINERLHFPSQSCTLGKRMSITIERVEYETPVLQGDQTDFRVYAKNTGDVSIDYLMMKIGNGNPSYVNQTLMPGEQKTYTFRVTIDCPEGYNKLIVSTDENGENVVYTDAIKVKVPRSNEHLTGEVEVTDGELQYIGKNRALERTLIPGTTLNFVCTLTNDEDYAYDDDIVFRLFRRTLDSSTLVYESEETVVIPSGEMLRISRTVEELIPGAWYQLMVYKRQYRMITAINSKDQMPAVFDIIPALSKAFQIGNVNYTGSFEKEHQLVLHAHVKNNSEVDFDTFDLVYDEDSQWENDRHHTYQVNLPAGQDVDIQLPLVFKKEGKQPFELTPSVRNCVIFSDTIDIKSPTEQSLEIKVALSVNDDIVEQDGKCCVSMLVSVKNNGMNDYDDSLEMTLLQYSEVWGFYRGHSTQTANVSLKPGEQTELTFMFESMDVDGKYSANVSYYSLQKVTYYNYRPSITENVTPRRAGVTRLSPNSPGYNETITVEAMPSDGYVFHHWEIDGKNMGTKPILTYKVRSSLTITAVFAEPNYNAELSYDIAEGWNWISMNLNSPELRVAHQFVEPFKDKTTRLLSYEQELTNDPRYGLMGNLTTINPQDGYKLLASEKFTHHLQGEGYRQGETTITLHRGWNWIGYMPVIILPVEDALQNLKPCEDDIVKGQNEFATYADGQWKGTLMEMKPGEGYMYFSGIETSFDYPVVWRQTNDNPQIRRREVKSPQENRWTFNSYKYPDNTTVVAKLVLDNDEVDTGKREVGAFCGQECRECGRQFDGLYFLTIHGATSEHAVISFKVYDNSSSKEYAVKETINLDGNAYGTVRNPLLLHTYQPTGIKESASGFTISPTLSRNRLYVKGDIDGIKNVSVMGINGVKLIENNCCPPAGIDVSMLPNGIYVVTIGTVNGIVFHGKVVKD